MFFPFRTDAARFVTVPLIHAARFVTVPRAHNNFSFFFFRTTPHRRYFESTIIIFLQPNTSPVAPVAQRYPVTL